MKPLELAAVHAQCFTTPRPWSAQEFTDLLAQKGVFLCSERPKGFLLGRIAGPEAELLTLAVAPKHRRQGIAGRLVRDFLQSARARFADAAFLEVAQTNQPARDLYIKHGFTEAGVRKDYYSHDKGPKVSATVMTRPL